MRDHDEHGAAMLDAVGRGDLDQARREAMRLSELRSEGPTDPVWKERLGALNAAVSRMAEAPGIYEASLALAGVAKTCGDCHAAIRRMGFISTGEPAARAAGVLPSMRRHEWAVQRMWEGLVIPSDDAWKIGARVLSETPFAPGLLTPGKTPVPKIGAMVQAVHDLGQRAEIAEQSETRVELFGDAMATCADCHRWLGGGPNANP